MTGRNIVLYVKSKLQDNMHKLLMQSFTKSKREWCIISNTYILLNILKGFRIIKIKFPILMISVETQMRNGDDFTVKILARF